MVENIRKAGARSHWKVLALFGVLSLVLSWPLPIRIATHLPGMPQWAFDESTFVWNIWYFQYALVDLLSSPLHSDLIYFPLGIDLILYTYNFFNALVAQPVHLAAGLPLASNLTVLLSTILSGYGTFLLVRYLLTRGKRPGNGQRSTGAVSVGSGPASFAAAVLAGLLYAFASNRTIYAALGHYDMVTTQWIPFYILALLRSLDGRLTARRRYRAAVLAGVFFAFNGLAEMITAMFLALFTLIVVLVQGLAVIRNSRRGTNRVHPVDRPAVLSLGHFAASLAVTGLVGALVWGPALFPILRQFIVRDFSLQGWGEAIPLSTDLLGWFTPTILHPLFGGDLVAELRRVQLRALEDGVTGFRDVNTVFLGWTSLTLALVGAAIFGRRVRIWIWTALVFGVLTLGPFLQIDGRYRFDLDGVETSFPLPYALLHYIPIIKANRAPNRNSVVLMLALAVLAGYALYWLWGKLETGKREGAGQPTAWRAGLQASVAGILALAVLFEHLALPLPLSDARVPAVYRQIAADPRPVSVLQVPLGWRNSFGVFGAERTQLQYYQSVHQKPMLGGNISRAPDFKMDYFKRLPLFQTIADVEFGRDVPETLWEAARAQAGELMYLYNVGYVLLFPPIPQRFPYADHWQDAWELTRALLPLESEPFWAQDGIEAYRVVQPEGQDDFQIALGTSGTFAYRGEGWDDGSEEETIYGLPAAWATAEESCLFVPLRGVEAEREYALSVQAHPYSYPGAPAQTAIVTVNGARLASQELGSDWQTLTWPVPGRILDNGLNRICLAWGRLATPRQVEAASRLIGTTGVSLPIDADLTAFADGGFIALFDEEGNQHDASAGRRGVNITVLDPQDGTVLKMQGFDTAANEYESQSLADFLAQVPAGSPVLVASRGDATAFLTAAAVDGLRSLGTGVSLEELQGNHFAVVGVQGAPVGTAAVTVDPDLAFVRVSLNRDRRMLATAVGMVEIR